MKLLEIIKGFLVKNKVENSSRLTLNEKLKISDEIELQLKKYEETYKLLGEYDKKSPPDPTVLAKPGRLQDFTSRVQ